MRFTKSLPTLLTGVLGLLVLGQRADCAAPKPQIELELVLGELRQPTDVQSIPGYPNLLAVAEKGGRLLVVELTQKKRHEWLKVHPETRSEQGLLGIAFHPMYAQNGRFFLHYSTVRDGQAIGRIEAWHHAGSDPRKGVPRAQYVVLEVEQPYGNHDGGQIAFGPDGLLYIGFGDGGAADDPHGHGQNLDSLLGSIVRIDVDGARPYAIPKDNPRVGQTGHDALWAWGLRNPWRFSFAPDGRLVVGDVGQNRLEEISFVPKGANLGWNIREANRCFKPKTGCKTQGLLDPIHQYGRDLGTSVTGGVVFQGRYVFADFSSGRIWDLRLPATGATAEARLLGVFPVHPTAFCVGADRALYLKDFDGRLFRVIRL